jgi:large subunit ribosomal protein L25
MKSTLQAEKRATSTRGHLRKLRDEGMVPGVLYGFGQAAEPIQIRAADLRPVLRKSHGATLLIDLTVGSDSSPVTTVIREVQQHPVTRQIQHCDLLKVDMSRKYHVTVPIVITGESTGVKNQGGVLDIHIREIDIKCRPDEIPSGYVLDVTSLELGQSIRVSEIPRGNEEFLTHADVAVVTVAVPRKIVEAAPVAEGEGEAAAAAEGAEGAEGAEEGKEAKEGKETKEAKEPKGAKGKKESA